MIQEYSVYTEEDQEVWEILFERQTKNLQGKSCSQYLECLKELYPAMKSNRIPNFKELDSKLEKTGWSIEVVKGLIPVEEFFRLLAKNKFCSSTWLRTKKQLDYLEEPDMFHDSFGHIPLLMDEIYANFMREFGQVGVDHIQDARVLTALQRLYWFTIEFGVIKGLKQTEVYGAGILSSFGEVNHIYENPNVKLSAFTLEEVINTPFITTEVQMKYFEIDSFDQLFSSLSDLRILIEKGLDITPALVS